MLNLAALVNVDQAYYHFILFFFSLFLRWSIHPQGGVRTIKWLKVKGDDAADTNLVTCDQDGGEGEQSSDPLRGRRLQEDLLHLVCLVRLRGRRREDGSHQAAESRRHRRGDRLHDDRRCRQVIFGLGHLGRKH